MCQVLKSSGTQVFHQLQSKQEFVPAYSERRRKQSAFFKTLSASLPMVSQWARLDPDADMQINTFISHFYVFILDPL